MDLNKLKNLSLKKRISLNLSVFIFFIGLILYYVVFPSMQDILNIRDQIDAQRADLEAKYQKSRSLKRLTSNLKKIELQFDRLDQIFINENRALEFITTLEGVANKNHLQEKINMDSFDNVKSDKEFKRMPLKILTDGNFMDQVHYLAGLESLNYYINIKSLEFTAISKDAGGRPGDVEMVLTAETYWK